MKCIVYSIILLVLILVSCSPTKVLDSWRDPQGSIQKSETILVISKSTDSLVRNSYENAIINELNTKGYQATASHSSFPGLGEYTTQEEVEQLLHMFRQKNIQYLLITSLKNAIETKKSQSMNTERLYKPLSAQLRQQDNVSVSTSYIIDMLLYDIGNSNQEKIIAAHLVEVLDPKSGDIVRKTFSKFVANQFN